MGRYTGLWVGLVVGAGGVGCSGGDDDTATPGTPVPETPTPSSLETFANPPELEPNEDGVYELHFRPGKWNWTVNGIACGPTTGWSLPPPCELPRDPIGRFE